MPHNLPKCPHCNKYMKVLFHNRFFCPNDCDKKGNMDCGHFSIQVIGHEYDPAIYPLCGEMSEWFKNNLGKHMNTANHTGTETDLENIVCMYIFDNMVDFNDKYNVREINTTGKYNSILAIRTNSSNYIIKIIIDLLVVLNNGNEYVLSFIMKSKQITFEI